jgi:hypothetical protein
LRLWAEAFNFTLGQTLKGEVVTDTVVERPMATIMMMVFFSGLALDIAVPAMVLTVMATLKWLVENWPTANDLPFDQKAETA